MPYLYRKRSRGYIAKRPSRRINYVDSEVVNAATQENIYVFTASSSGTIGSITLDIESTHATSIGNQFFALVYVPDGYDANNINNPTINPGPFYEPEETVLLAGIVPSNTQPYRFKKKIGRRMSPGDRIALCLYNGRASGDDEITFVFQASYIE